MPTVSSQKDTSFRIDLTQIEGEGDFNCPKCNAVISPDDLSEKVYTILSIEGNEADSPTRIVLECLNCKSVITLDGFNSC
jgi:predicted RNA-binding Zn-ribbon protein involved in translation (DUF1610 family)